jgi:hypothetical protein
MEELLLEFIFLSTEAFVVELILLVLKFFLSFGRNVDIFGNY